jgi:manganese/zinc/iron transport system substrate-binding protein
MIADAARIIGGEAVRVEGLMGPGIDPHLYQATAGDIRKLEGARLILTNGLHLEGRLGELLESLEDRGASVVAVAEAIPKDQLLAKQEGGGQPDPHVWFDVSLWRKAVEAVRDGLSKAFPKESSGFQERAEAYLQELDALDSETSKALSRVPKDRRVLVTAHDAFGYFGRRYGFEVVGIQGISTASEATVQSISRIAGLVAERKVPAVFIESSVPAKTVEALKKAAADRGWSVRIGGELFSDALGPEGSGADTYAGMVRANAKAIADGLGDPVP